MNINLPTNQGSYKGFETTAKIGPNIRIELCTYMLVILRSPFLEEQSKINYQKMTIGKLSQYQ